MLRPFIVLPLDYHAASTHRKARSSEVRYATFDERALTGDRKNDRGTKLEATRQVQNKLPGIAPDTSYLAHFPRTRPGFAFQGFPLEAPDISYIHHFSAASGEPAFPAANATQTLEHSCCIYPPPLREHPRSISRSRESLVDFVVVGLPSACYDNLPLFLY